MSAGYGNIVVKFRKEDGSLDADMAQKVFDYCKERFEWFETIDTPNRVKHGTVLVCSEGTIYTDGDGLDVKRGDPAATEGDWLMEVYNKFKPFNMKAQLTNDFSESSYDENDCAFYAVKEKNGERNLVCIDSFDYTHGAKYDIEDFLIFDGDDYWLAGYGLNQYELKLKNKKTGREFYFGYPVYVMTPDWEEDDFVELEYPVFKHLRTKDGEFVRIDSNLDLSDEIVLSEDSDYIIDSLDYDGYLEEGEEADFDEWEFAGIGIPSRFFDN